WGCDNVSGYPCLGGSWNWSNPPEQNVKALGLAGRDPGKVVEIGVIGLPIPVAPTIPAAPPAPSWVDWHYDQADWTAAGLGNVITVPTGSPMCSQIYTASTAAP